MRRPVAITATTDTSWSTLVHTLEALGDRVLGEPSPGAGTYVRTLAAPLGRRGTLVAHPVQIVVRAHHRETEPPHEQWVIDLTATGPGAAHYPAFHGTLDVAPLDEQACALSLAGDYEVPLGLAGRVGDAVGGHRMATASLERLLGEVVATLEQGALAAPEPDADTATPAPAPEQGSDRPPSEPTDLYLG